MYICLDCLQPFFTPKDYTEKHGLDTPMYENTKGCPYCGGAYTNAVRCDNPECEVFIKGDYVHIKDGSNYCEKCYQLKSIGDDD